MAVLAVAVLVCGRFGRNSLLMGSHLTATGSHLPYGITQCYLLPDTSECAHLTPASKPVLDLPTPEGWKAELT